MYVVVDDQAESDLRSDDDVVVFPEMLLRHAISTLFPYTTLFRSRCRSRPNQLRPARRRLQALQGVEGPGVHWRRAGRRDRKSTRLNSSHMSILYAVFCLKKQNMR